MAAKCIAITSEAYERLKSFKESKESFSDVIYKITKKSSLRELAGILSHEEAEELKDNIKDLRKRLDKELEKRLKKYNL